MLFCCLLVPVSHSALASRNLSQYHPSIQDLALASPSAYSVFQENTESDCPSHRDVFKRVINMINRDNAMGTLKSIQEHRTKWGSCLIGFSRGKAPRHTIVHSLFADTSKLSQIPRHPAFCQCYALLHAFLYFISISIPQYVIYQFVSFSFLASSTNTVELK